VGTWLRCLPDNVRSLILTASQHGETIAAAVLIEHVQRRRAVLRVKQLHFHATGRPELDCVAIEHNGFVGTSRADLWPAFLEWFALQSLADELVVPGMDEGIVTEVRNSRTLLHDVSEMPTFASTLSDKGAGVILSKLSPNARQQLRRNLRAAQHMGELRCTAAITPEEAFAAFAALKELHIRSWSARGRQHAFRQPFFEQFHRALILEGLSKGAIQLLRISAGTEVVGYLYNFRYNNREYTYQSGFDTSKRALRPGYISHFLAMGQSTGATSYDFLAGDNRLKRTFCQQVSVMCWHRFAKPRLGLRLEAVLRCAARSIRGGRSPFARGVENPGKRKPAHSRGL